MRYVYQPHDPSHYATDLRLESRPPEKYLIWDAAPNHDSLIVQTPFRQSADGYMLDICRELGQTALRANRFTQISHLPDANIWVRYVTWAEKINQRGCPVNSEACTYTVFACIVQEDETSVYAPPQERAMINSFCDVPMNMRVSISKQVIKSGSWLHRQESNFYCIAFLQTYHWNYVDGDLQYEVSGITIPITRQMLEQKSIFVKTQVPPRLISRNPGLTVEIVWK